MDALSLTYSICTFERHYVMHYEKHGHTHYLKSHTSMLRNPFSLGTCRNFLVLLCKHFIKTKHLRAILLIVTTYQAFMYYQSSYSAVWHPRRLFTCQTFIHLGEMPLFMELLMYYKLSSSIHALWIRQVWYRKGWGHMILESTFKHAYESFHKAFIENFLSSIESIFLNLLRLLFF